MFSFFIICCWWFVWKSWKLIALNFGREQKLLLYFGYDIWKAEKRTRNFFFNLYPHSNFNQTEKWQQQHQQQKKEKKLSSLIVFYEQKISDLTFSFRLNFNLGLILLILFIALPLNCNVLYTIRMQWRIKLDMIICCLPLELYTPV